MEPKAPNQFEKFRVFDNMLEGVQVVDPGWRYVYVNDTVLHHGKTTREALLGRTMMQEYPGIEKTELFGALERCMNERSAAQLINKFEFPDGAVGWFDLRLEPVDEGTLIMSFDITQQKILEMDLRDLNKELEEKIAARTRELEEALEREKSLNVMKSHFLSMASHEFRTPLSIVSTSLALVKKYISPQSSEATRKHFRKMNTAVGNLTRILDEFLMLEQFELKKLNLEIDSFSIREFAEKTIEAMEGMLKPQQRIRYQHEGGDNVHVNRQILQNILFNLLSNANKYSESDIELGILVNEEGILLSVKDRGIGIPAEDQKELFKRFFRATNTSEIQGTGLGLYLVKQYLQLLEGRIDFSSNPGEGTEFVVYLPRNQKAGTLRRQRYS